MEVPQDLCFEVRLEQLFCEIDLEMSQGHIEKHSATGPVVRPGIAEPGIHRLGPSPGGDVIVRTINIHTVGLAFLQGYGRSMEFRRKSWPLDEPEDSDLGSIHFTQVPGNPLTSGHGSDHVVHRVISGQIRGFVRLHLGSARP
jgi:hypothetical protein